MKHDFFGFPDDAVFASVLFGLGYWYSIIKPDVMTQVSSLPLGFHGLCLMGHFSLASLLCSTYYMTKPQKLTEHSTQIYAG